MTIRIKKQKTNKQIEENQTENKLALTRSKPSQFTEEKEWDKREENLRKTIDFFGVTQQPFINIIAYSVLVLKPFMKVCVILRFLYAFLFTLWGNLKCICLHVNQSHHNTFNELLTAYYLSMKI